MSRKKYYCPDNNYLLRNDCNYVKNNNSIPIKKEKLEEFKAEEIEKEIKEPTQSLVNSGKKMGGGGRVSKEKEQEIIEYLREEIEKKDPASLTQISKYFGFKSSKTVTRLAKQIFTPEIFEEKWGSKRGQKIMSDEIIYQRLIEELKKPNPMSTESIGKELGFSDGGPVRRVAKERIPSEIYNKIWGRDIIKASDIEDLIIKRLEKEIKSENPASLRSIGIEFGFSSGNPVREVAIRHFPREIYEEVWSRQHVSEDMEADIIEILRDEIKKDSPRPLQDIGHDFGFKSGDPIYRIAKKIFPEDIYMNKWGRPSTSPIIIKEIENYLKEQIERENPMSLSEISRKFNLKDYGVVRRIAKDLFPERIYQELWGIEEIPEEIKIAIRNDILNTNLSMNQIAQKFNISVVPIRTISSKIELEDQDYSHNERFPQMISAFLGTQFHLIIKKIATKHLLRFFIKAFSEILVNIKTEEKIDLLIPNIDKEKRFIELISSQNESIKVLTRLNLNIEKIRDFRAFLFDFTMDLSKKNIIGKIIKYQHPNMLFFIVDYRRMGIWRTRPSHTFNIPIDNRIKFPQNIKIIDYIFFADLIGLKDRLRQLFFDAVELIADIMILESEERNYNDNLKKLQTNQFLIEQDLFYNQEFEDFLKSYYLNINNFLRETGSIDKFLV